MKEIKTDMINLGFLPKRLGVLISDEKGPYLVYETKVMVKKYNPKYGDDKECICGHSYYRHFDGYADDDIMADCGCKYCTCRTFVPKTEDMDEGEAKRLFAFHSLCLGDTVIVYDDESSHDYIEHRLKITSMEENPEYIYEENPTGIVYYGDDLDKESFGDEYLTKATVVNFVCEASEKKESGE